ncbi:hypothetical protein A8990_10526 [Paenibacillus taihuensis]|uniref:DUF2642 domain-containing protein n=1 Tax=Paenibacillus taihuensis TaxID=1156355 RepID=A0A3D9SCK9_9BACL|nr:DUF2642 domain-containing protein [Paenibacillus taihuensis]REE91322.1 hypothetical protein A8990_10526 [Paenibacillus taihuensis]
MNDFKSLIGNKVVIEVSGKRMLPGKLIDVGSDMVVLLHQLRYLYIPLAHVHNLKVDFLGEEGSEGSDQADEPSVGLQVEDMNVAKILQEAKGLFVEIYVSGNKSIHGHLNGIMNDYFTLYSPIYGTVYIATHHMKWLIPYPTSHVPYAKSTGTIPAGQTQSNSAKTLGELFKKEEGKMAVIDLSSASERIGVIKRISGSGMINLIDAEGYSTLHNIVHVKTMVVPK